MKRRLRRILIRLGIVLGVLFALGLGLFTWFAYWPLEGSVDRVEALVPADVDFVLVTSWSDLKATGWIQKNVLETPVVPEVEAQLGELRRALDQIEDIERQINSQIPLGLAEFGVEEDVFKGEVVAAGRWWEGIDPRRGPPQWQELLVLTRISWKPKFFSALKHGFVRDRVGPAVSVTEEAEGIYRFKLHGMAVPRVGQPSDFGRGAMPPPDVWYGYRHKDVLAFSNSLDLIEDVTNVVEFPDSGRRYVDRPRIALDVPTGGIAASLDVAPLERYLVEGMKVAPWPIPILKRYVTASSLDRLKRGHLLLPSLDQMRGHAEIRYRPNELGKGVRGVYELDPTPVRSGICNLVPAKDTFGVFLLRSPPRHLIEGIYEDFVDSGTRRMWNDNLHRMGNYATIHDLFAEFAGELGGTAAIAVGRLSDVFDRVEYPKFYSDPKGNPDANEYALGWTFVVELNRGTRPADLDAYLKEKIPLLGASPDLEQVEYRGLTYTRVQLEQRIADFALVRPAYILAQQHLIFCSNESYFRKILDTIVDPNASPPLGADETFRATAEALPEKAHVFLFVDLEKLFRVPDRIAPGEGPRGFLWDRRNLWVIDNRNARKEAIRYRAHLRAQLGHPPSFEEDDEIEEQVSRRVAGWEQRYPDFLEEWRRQLLGYRHLRSTGLAFAVEGDVLIGDLAVLLRDGEEDDAGD